MERKDIINSGQKVPDPEKQLSSLNNKKDKYPVTPMKPEPRKKKVCPNSDPDNFDEGDYEDINDNLPEL